MIDDFLDRYVDRREYVLIQMSTISIHMALAGEILDSLVKPDLKDECNNIRKVVFFATKK